MWGPHVGRSVFLCCVRDWTQDPEYPRQGQVLFHWATFPAPRASGPHIQRMGFPGLRMGSWHCSFAKFKFLCSQRWVNPGCGDKPSIESFECLKSAKEHKPWPEQTRARQDWLLRSSAVASMGTSTAVEGEPRAVSLRTKSSRWLEFRGNPFRCWAFGMGGCGWNLQTVSGFSCGCMWESRLLICSQAQEI